MAETTEQVAEAYVRLGLAIEQHLPGYVDAFDGPAAWKREAEAAGKRPVDELAHEAARLLAAVDSDRSMDTQRRDYLLRQLNAVETSLALLGGQHLSLIDEVQALYDISPVWTDEAIFDAAHEALADLLPPGPNLHERMATRRTAVEVPVDRIEPLIPEVFAELRRRTRAKYPLPDEEGVELQFVKDQPWTAYNWYLGDRRSRIDINTDLPQQITRLVDLLAHEGYPGHHTEHSLKETLLWQQQGRAEATIALINSPSCVVAEGIATRALDMVLTGDEWIAWHRDELFPRAGCTHLDAEREYQIGVANEALRDVRGNAAFMLHDQGESEESVMAYIERYGLNTRGEAQRSVAFLSNPLYRSYTYTYTEGGMLLDRLFEARGERDYWFNRLLTEPVTPEQIRAWISAG